MGCLVYSLCITAAVVWLWPLLKAVSTGSRIASWNRKVLQPGFVSYNTIQGWYVNNGKGSGHTLSTGSSSRRRSENRARRHQISDRRNADSDLCSSLNDTNAYNEVKFIAGIEAHIQLAIPSKIFCSCYSTASCMAQEYGKDERDALSMHDRNEVQSSTIGRCVELYNSLSGMLSCYLNDCGRRRLKEDIKGGCDVPFEEYIVRYWRDKKPFSGTSVSEGHHSDNEPIHRTNKFACPICKGEPGGMPSISPLAILYGIYACQEFHCEVSRSISFERKVYSYYDLPKRYQLTQVHNPIGKNGHIRLGNGRKINISRLHLEEDTARALSRSSSDVSLDYNRCGIGLIEVVTDASEVTLPELLDCCSVIYDRVTKSGLCKGRMHEGNIRFDINLSKPSEGVERIEIKNLNSFRRIRKGTIQWLCDTGASDGIIEVNDESNMGKTHWSDTSYDSDWSSLQNEMFGDSNEKEGDRAVGRTFAWMGTREGVAYMRDKSSGSHYMNLYDNNIPSIALKQEIIDRVKSAALCNTIEGATSLSCEYPRVPKDLIGVIEKSDERISLFRRLEKAVGCPSLVAKWMVNYIVPLVPLHNINVEQLAELIREVDAEHINMDTAKRILVNFLSSGMQLKEYLELHNIKTLGKAEMRSFVDKYLNDNSSALMTGGVDKSELTKLLRKIVAQSGGRLSYSLVKDYLVERLAPQT